jgi:hypothetical protein
MPGEATLGVRWLASRKACRGTAAKYSYPSTRTSPRTAATPRLTSYADDLDGPAVSSGRSGVAYCRIGLLRVASKSRVLSRALTRLTETRTLVNHGLLCSLPGPIPAAPLAQAVRIWPEGGLMFRGSPEDLD